MAGYFDYVGRIFTEKGAWYKILTIVVLQGLTMMFSPNALIKQAEQGTMHEFNIPAILLYLLTETLTFGFVVQVYNGAMNNKPKLLPDLDFMDMFVKSVRLVPFWLVWMIYLGVFGVFVALTMPTLARGGGVAAVLFVALFAIFWIFMCLMLAVLLIIHSKSFSFRYVLNPLTPFRIAPKLIGPVLGISLLFILLSVVLYGVLFGAAVLLGVSGGNEMAASLTIAMGVLVAIWLYVYDVFLFAYNLKLADIVKEKLGDTEYLDSDYDAPVADIEDEE